MVTTIGFPKSEANNERAAGTGRSSLEALTERVDAAPAGAVLISTDGFEPATPTTIPASGLGVFTLTCCDESIDIPELALDGIVERVMSSERWPAPAMMIDRDMAIRFLGRLKASGISLNSIEEMSAAFMILGASEGEGVESIGEVAVSPEQYARCSLSSETKSKLLRLLLESCNIEELFPNHPWDRYQTEAAAVCYHLLAANFIRLSDPLAAHECLRCCERLEDSPRTLALHGMISKMRGETLGAVANMVSSLQQYEDRKKKTSDHYQKIEPGNFEEINSQLVAGLEALNRKDNELALEHFTQAVFKFDPFYVNCGFDPEVVRPKMKMRPIRRL